MIKNKNNLCYHAPYLIVEEVAEGCGILEDESSDWEEGKQEHVDLIHIINTISHWLCPCTLHILYHDITM